MKRGPLVLVADDDAGVRFTLRGLLEDEGLRVIEAVDGEVSRGNPVGDEIPGWTLEGERVSVDHEVGLQYGSAVFAADLKQAAVAHRKHVEGVKRAVGSADIGQ